MLKAILNPYGCPLYSQTDYVKVDWTVWTAALNNDQQIFRKFIYSLYKYMNENKNRVLMADTYNIMNYKTRVTSWGRPIACIYFIRLLEMELNKNNAKYINSFIAVILVDGNEYLLDNS